LECGDSSPLSSDLPDLLNESFEALDNDALSESASGENEPPNVTTQSLESLLLEGLASGEAVPMAPDDWQALRRNVRERLQGRMERSRFREHSCITDCTANLTGQRYLCLFTTGVT
jgi:hypothetical protein